MLGTALLLSGLVHAAGVGIMAVGPSLSEVGPSLSEAAPPPPVSVDYASGDGSMSQLANHLAQGEPLVQLLERVAELDRSLAAALAALETGEPELLDPRQAKVAQRMVKPARLGYAHAQYNLALRRLAGRGVPRDRAGAVEGLGKAARQGYVKAQLLLGYLLVKGGEAERDLAEAHFWWTLAADRGSQAAATGYELLQPRMTPEEILRSRGLASEWRSAMGDLAPPPKPAAEDESRQSPLMAAVASGDGAALRTMLAQGGDAEDTDLYGRTAMISAAWRGDTRSVDILLEVGAEPEVVDLDGKTPLIWAASNGHEEVVAGLTDAGVNIDSQDGGGLTALMRAAWNGHAGTVKALLEAGADVGLRDKSGRAALDYASDLGYQDIILLLQPRKDGS